MTTIDSAVWDRRGQHTLLHLSDGTRRINHDDHPIDPSSVIASVAYLRSPKHLVFTTDFGDTVVGLVPSRTRLSPITGRPVVYLDQNHWSTLSKSIHAPARVPVLEVEAARRILHLAKTQQIILPMSSGHMSETGQHPDQGSRYHLALTILEASMGWQLRDPIGLWRRELEATFAALRGQPPPDKADAITLEPWAVHEDSMSRPQSDTFRGMRGVQHIFDTMLATCVYFDLMLDREQTVEDPPAAWAEGQQRLTDDLRRVPSGSRRRVANALAMQDMSDTIARAAASLEVDMPLFRRWLTDDWPRPLPHAPAVDSFRAVMTEHHLNSAMPWHTNDLNDLIHLSAASAYSDFVVGEKRTAALLNQASRHTPIRATVIPNLRALVRALPVDSPAC